ncbi:MAG: C10 family peptidase [Bacteroidales bacterium]|nr:C10 family peptidase [Bacteroidales bacterium]
MKKTILFSLIFLFPIVLGSSCSKQQDAGTLGLQPTHEEHSVSLEEARIELLDFLSHCYGETRSAERQIAECFTISGVETRSDANLGAPPIHVFNFVDENGYALVSGDDRTPDVLALIESGTFSLEQPQDIREMILLKNIDTYCRILEHLPVVDASGQVREYEEYGPYIAPAFITRDGEHDYQLTHYGQQLYCNWGQGSPFNNNCYVSGTTTHAKAGCVAIAVAQIMFHWSKNATYGGEYYDWRNMSYVTNKSIIPMDEETWPMIQRFVRALGDSNNLDMDYGENVSLAYTSNASRTFSHFGFYSGGSLEPFDASTLKENITSGPVLVRGNDIRRTYDSGLVSYGSGHCWVVDKVITRSMIPNEGEEDLEMPTEYYLHVNWGLDGWHNGYYLSPNFNMGNWGASFVTRTVVEGTPSLYQYNLEMNVGIRANGDTL